MILAIATAFSILIQVTLLGFTDLYRTTGKDLSWLVAMSLNLKSQN
jgi:hypothetical protein